MTVGGPPAPLQRAIVRARSLHQQTGRCGTRETPRQVDPVDDGRRGGIDNLCATRLFAVRSPQHYRLREPPPCSAKRLRDVGACTSGASSEPSCDSQRSLSVRWRIDDSALAKYWIRRSGCADRPLGTEFSRVRTTTRVCIWFANRVCGSRLGAMVTHISPYTTTD